MVRQQVHTVGNQRDPVAVDAIGARWSARRSARRCPARRPVCVREDRGAIERGLPGVIVPFGLNVHPRIERGVREHFVPRQRNPRSLSQRSRNKGQLHGSLLHLGVTGVTVVS